MTRVAIVPRGPRPASVAPRVNSLVFEARIRPVPAFQANRRFPVVWSRTTAPESRPAARMSPASEFPRSDSGLAAATAGRVAAAASAAVTGRRMRI